MKEGRGRASAWGCAFAWGCAVLAYSGWGCIYALDSDELEAKAAGTPSTAVQGLDPADAGRGYTTSLDTPPIELDFVGRNTTRDPCVSTTAQARQILEQNCAQCHAAPASMAGFDAILDFPRLVTIRSSSTDDPETGQRARLVVPGDPDGSRVYRRILSGEMPPQRTPPLRRPSTSDISILRAWIESCLPEAGAGAPDPDGGTSDG